jgi:hypothetical protein
MTRQLLVEGLALGGERFKLGKQLARWRPVWPEAG